MAINALTTDLDIYVADEGMTKRVGPCDTIGNICSRCGVDRVYRKCGELHLEIYVVDKVTITGDNGRNLLSESRVSIEYLLDGLDSEVSMSAVDNLEVSNLRITREVNILGAISYKLHKTTTHIFL
jgi:hypothetical protein